MQSKSDHSLVVSHVRIAKAAVRLLTPQEKNATDFHSIKPLTCPLCRTLPPGLHGKVEPTPLWITSVHIRSQTLDSGGGSRKRRANPQTCVQIDTLRNFKTFFFCYWQWLSSFNYCKSSGIFVPFSLFYFFFLQLTDKNEYVRMNKYIPILLTLGLVFPLQ